MTIVLRVLAALVGLAAVAVGLWWSPAPWLAPIVVGAALTAWGLLSEADQ